MRMYQVVAKCGYVGRDYYVKKSFAVKAADGKEAAKIVRNYPRVKHHHKDAILDVIEISYGEYLSILSRNNEDPYFSCSNVQEQRSYIEQDVYREYQTTYECDEMCSKAVYYGKTQLRNPKKYMKYITVERCERAC